MAWLYGYPNVITGCLKVYAIQITVWREEVLDSLEMKEFCFNAHGRVNLTWSLFRLHRAIYPMQHWRKGKTIEQ